jgi:hypothetical protein
VIGAERSAVTGGEVVAGTFPCPAGRTTLERSQNETGALVVRGVIPAPNRLKGPGKRPPVLLHGLSPVFAIGGPGVLVIRRLDAAGKPLKVSVRRKQLLDGRLFDLHAVGRALEPGAAYRATFGRRKAVFEIDADARPGDTPIAGRLLRFPKGRR